MTPAPSRHRQPATLVCASIEMLAERGHRHTDSITCCHTGRCAHYWWRRRASCVMVHVVRALCCLSCSRNARSASRSGASSCSSIAPPAGSMWRVAPLPLLAAAAVFGVTFASATSAHARRSFAWARSTIPFGSAVATSTSTTSSDHLSQRGAFARIRRTVAHTSCGGLTTGLLLIRWATHR